MACCSEALEFDDELEAIGKTERDKILNLEQIEKDQVTYVRKYETTAKAELKKSVVVNDRWEIDEQMAQGTDGAIFRVFDLHKGRQACALKAQLWSMVHGTEKVEDPKRDVEFGKEFQKLHFLTNICKSQIVPRPYDFGLMKGFNWFVMGLAGDNLYQKKRKAVDHRLPITDVILIGMKLISMIEEFHDAWYLHNDLKPSNIAVSLEDPNSLVFLDLGRSAFYRKIGGDKMGELERMKTHVELVGTLSFISLATVYGVTPTRRDDLESIFYNLVYLAQGTLPWHRNVQTEEEIAEVLKLRRMTTVKEILGCGPVALPPCFEQILRICRGLRFQEKPPYERIFHLLQETLDSYFGGSAQVVAKGFSWNRCSN